MLGALVAMHHVILLFHTKQMGRKVTKILLLVLLQELMVMGYTITKRQTDSSQEDFDVQCSDDPCSTLESQNCTCECHLPA